MADRGSAELAAIRAAMAQAMAGHNRTLQDDLAGLSPTAMAALRDDAFGPDSPLLWRGAASSIPLFRAITTLLTYFSAPEGARLTPQGRLPQKLLRELHALHEWERHPREMMPRLEEDLPLAVLLHALAIGQGWVRKRKGHYLLSRAGKQWLAMPPDEQALQTMKISCMVYDWGYLDGYAPMPMLQQGWGYLIWLLLRFGSEPRPVSFYRGWVLRTWPFLLDMLPEPKWGTRESDFHNLFEVRVLYRWLAWLGFVQLSREPRLDADTLVTVTPLLEACWQAR
ncbi:MAG: hypothetical protein ACK4SX_03380 [Alcanivoracaceae bacterium]